MIRSAAELTDALPGVRGTARLSTTLLHGALFLAILVSPLVFIEPSPYEAACGLLVLACIAAGVKLDRRLLPLAILLIVFNVGGMFTLMLPRSEDNAREAMIYVAVSFYLGMTAVVYACIFSSDSLRRLLILRRAYLVAAFVASLVGIAGYFGLLPSATLYGRASATFKDPNVFGPFLVMPMMMLLLSIVGGAIKLRHLLLLGVMAFALLLSFSRGAWSHFALSAGVALLLAFLTAPDIRTRFRLITLTMAAVFGLGVLLAGALSIGSLGEMLEQRAKLTQSYDVGSGGRFGLQELAVGEVLKHPAGMGPFEFGRAHGGQQHNTYFQGFLNYGWVGGFCYIALVLLTLLIGFRQCLVATPWQPYLIAAWATFVGEAMESFIIDTDHWRHYFLILGLIWGLSVATIKEKPRRFPTKAPQ